MSGDHNMHQKSKSYLDDFECPRCGHCCHIEEEHTNTLRQAAQKAVQVMDAHMMRADTEEFYEAKEALRQALEEKQDPVAWISDSPKKGNGRQLHWTKSEAWRWSSNITPLYTAPPKREWVGLTDEEKIELWNKHESHWRFDDGLMAFTRAIEAKLKEKNT